MGESARLSIPTNVVFEILDGEAVLLNLDGGAYFSLNATATRIWELIEEHGDRALVCEAMVDEFSIEPDLAEQDVDKLLDELKVRGLVEIA